MLHHLLTLLTCLSTTIALPAKHLPVRQSTDSFRDIAYYAYFQDANHQPYNILPIIENPSHITHLNLFSVDLRTSGPNLTIGGVAPTDSSFLGDLWGEVKQVQQAGVKVLASIGAYQAECWILLQDDFNTWYPILLDFLQRYELDGVDLDIEPNAQGQTPNGIAAPLQLIQALRNDMAADFIISMAPVAADLTANPPEYSGFDYKQLDNAAVGPDGQHQIDFFNGQFYNGWGDCSDASTYDSIILNGYSPDRVIFGVLADSEDGNGFCSISTLTTTIKTIRTTYPTMGGADGYELVRAGQDDDLQNWQWFQGIYNASTTALLAL
ncbi:glycoside hydrolase superfamily [Kockovaella imperatae]|uniref:Glycoside hydrolase superfamily n=1 Tax=Kockovaella imperatae TaxID=4999 RepID=A0A1Y1UNB3_9TREE|nr:glycoside hydrolase superfamily [Kockovaella imperatae]ORX39550.1 glycoside hydrolase superfamily [Kockovaella imperatae]